MTKAKVYALMILACALLVGPAARSQRYESADPIIRTTKYKVRNVESKGKEIIEKVKVDFIFSSNATSGATEFLFSGGEKYHLYAFGESDRVTDIKMKLYKCIGSCDAAFDRKIWSPIKQEYATGVDATIDFSPSDQESGYYKIELTATFKSGLDYTRYGLIIGRDDACWEWNDAETAEKECSIYSFVDLIAETNKLFAEKKIDIVGFETGILHQGIASIFPRTLYKSNSYSFLAFSDKNIDDIILALGKPKGTDIDWLYRANGDESDFERITNFVPENNEMYSIAVHGLKFSSNSAVGKFAILMALKDVRMRPYPESSEKLVLSTMRGKRVIFNKIDQMELGAGDRWKEKQSLDVTGEVYFCNDLCTVIYTLNDEKLVYEVYNRWKDEDGNYHFFARSEGSYTEEGIKFVLSSDQKRVYVVDLSDTETQFWHSVSRTTTGRDISDCSCEMPETKVSGEEEETRTTASKCTHNPSFSELQGKRIEFSQKSVYDLSERDADGKLISNKKSTRSNTGYLSVSYSLETVTYRNSTTGENITYRITDKDYSENEEDPCDDLYILEADETNGRSSINLLINRDLGSFIIVKNGDYENVEKYTSD